MSPNDADGMANSVDPDQSAPLGAVWSGSALFAQAYLSETKMIITVYFFLALVKTTVQILEYLKILNYLMPVALYIEQTDSDQEMSRV